MKDLFNIIKIKTFSVIKSRIKYVYMYVRTRFLYMYISFILYMCMYTCVKSRHKNFYYNL